MLTLKLSDLFIQHGKTFNGNIRISDQNKLIERLREYEILNEQTKEIEYLIDCHGIIPYWWIEEMLFPTITRLCAKHRIDVV